MKLIFVFTSLLLGSYAFSQNFWEIRDSVKGAPRSVCAAFTLEGQGYVVGGVDDLSFKRKMYSYNQVQNDWDEEVSLGGPNGDGLDRGSASAFSIGTKGYVCLGQGQTNGYFEDLWEYDLTTAAWTQKADFAGGPRRQAVAFAIGNYAYVGTGQDGTGFRNDFYRYDPINNMWEPMADFAGTPRKQAVGFAMGDDGYVGTGDDGVLRNDFWQYNVALNEWFQKATFPGTARSGATGWGTFPTGFIATGEDLNSEFKKDVWEYSYFNNTWVQRSDFPGPGRKNAFSFVLDGTAFLGAGYGGVFFDDFYAYYGILGIEENQSQVESSVYPIPAQESITIEVKNASEITKLDLFDLTGKKHQVSFQGNTNKNNISLDLSTLEAGTYLYVVSMQNGTTSNGKITVL
jgi:N-acetylneuraminic acid mutarotase